MSGENYAILEVDVEDGGIQPVDEGSYQCLTNDASFGSANVTVTILVWGEWVNPICSDHSNTLVMARVFCMHIM